MLQRSSGSVRVFSFDRERVLEVVRQAARQLRVERPEVEDVRLFGSVARDQAVPGSDVDLLVVVRSPDARVWFRRSIDYAGYFDGSPVPVELFCYTREELQEGLTSGSPFFRELDSARSLEG